MVEGVPCVDTPRGGPTLALIFVATLAVRGALPGQPIVENYVGRQIPTAMVARNLEKGSGVARPRIDVAPFPNYFLVEPPVYATAVVAFKRLTGLTVEASGRLVSALGVAAGAWGIFGLSARRSGRGIGLIAAALFGLWPVAIRYGRAFQPDALMLGCVVAGVSCWDRGRDGRRTGWLGAGSLLLAAGLSLKVISAFVLFPLMIDVIPRGRFRQYGLAAAVMVPAILWYVHAAILIREGGGSRASADNGAIWLRSLDPAALLAGGTFGHVFRALGWRSFTPLGIPLAVVGLFLGRHESRLWAAWGVSALLAMGVVAPKLHHEYYWLCLVPVVSAGAAGAIFAISSRGRGGNLAASAAGLLLIGLSAVLSASTWRTPPEWRTLREAGRVVRSVVPPGDWLAAPEALIYESDRQGCRVEFSGGAARRAAGEWPGVGAATTVRDAADLVEFYRDQGARFFADVTPEEPEASRMALHDAIRRRYKLVWDRDGVLVADLRRRIDGANAPDDPQGR